MDAMERQELTSHKEETERRTEMLDKEQITLWDAKVKEIGKFLGMEFSARTDEREWNYYSYLKNGNKVLCFHAGDKDRWMISVDFPRDAKGQMQTGYGDARLEITVSMAKCAEKIAKDIKSRLIPEYEAQLVKVLERIEKANAYAAGRLAQIRKVAEFLGVDEPKDDEKRNAIIYLGHEQKGIYSIEAYGKEKVKIKDIEVSAELAIEILKVVGYGKKPTALETILAD